MEYVYFGLKYGKVKVIGILFGVGGVFFFVLYKGKEIYFWLFCIYLGGWLYSDIILNIFIFVVFFVFGGVIFYFFWVLL